MNPSGPAAIRRRFRPAGVALAVAAGCAGPAPTPSPTAEAPRPALLYRCDFEDGEAPGLRIVHGNLTRDPAEAVGGSVSLEASSLDATGEWTTVLEGDGSVVLPPGHTYRIQIRSRILDPGDYEARATLELFSPGAGKAFSGCPAWTREKGAVDSIDGLFEIRDTPDFRLRVRLHHRIAVAIDDIVVWRCAGAAPGDGDPIRRVDPGPDPDLAWLDGVRREEGSAATVGDMLSVAVNGGCGIKFWPWWETIARETRLDWADWNPLTKDDDGAARTLGIRTTASGAEYQEYYIFEGEAPDTWDRRFETYFEDGFARSYENTFQQDEFFGKGGYFMCHNGPRWHAWIGRQLESALARFEGVCQDNIGCAPFDKPWGSRGCYCPGCERKFRERLAARYSAGELARWGIDDLSRFSFRERFLAAGRWGARNLEDPVAREWIKFQYLTHLLAWKDYALRTKRIGRAQGRFAPFGGNQFGGNGTWPFALLLSPWNDYIEIEDVYDSPPGGIVDRSLAYKVGLASGRHEKPVWVRAGPPGTNPAAWTVAAGEALANGGVKAVEFGETIYYIEPVQQERWPAKDGRAVYETYKAYGKMVDENRPAFAGSRSGARIAVVYSLPSMMWSHFPPFRIESGHGFNPPPFRTGGPIGPDATPFDRLQGVSSLLDERHLQHDVVVFGHPELWRDEALPVGLDRYRALVLPYAPCLSDAQAAAVRAFAARGGCVVRVGDAGVRDEDFNPRARPVLEGVAMPDLLAERDAALAALAAGGDLETDAPPAVRVNRRRVMDGQGVTVHVLNYGNDIEHGRLATTPPVRIAFPREGPVVDCALRIAFGRDAKEIPFRIEGGRIVCTVPPVEGYAAVVFTTRAAWDRAVREAKERRARDRERVREERARTAKAQEPRGGK